MCTLSQIYQFLLGYVCGLIVLSIIVVGYDIEGLVIQKVLIRKMNRFHWEWATKFTTFLADIIFLFDHDLILLTPRNQHCSLMHL